MQIRNFFDLPLHKEVIHEGVGACLHTTVFDGPELETPIRFINYTVVPPHGSFGLHTHGNDNEIYVVLSGEGVYTENGAQQRVTPGSLMVNGRHHTHGIENTGEEDLKLLVLEVYNP